MTHCRASATALKILGADCRPNGMDLSAYWAPLHSMPNRCRSWGYPASPVTPPCPGAVPSPRQPLRRCYFRENISGVVFDASTLGVREVRDQPPMAGGVALRDYPHAVDVQVRELPRAKWTQHSPFIGLLRDVAVDHLRVDWQSACCRDSYATAKVQAGVLPVWVTQ